MDQEIYLFLECFLRESPNCSFMEISLQQTPWNSLNSAILIELGDQMAPVVYLSIVGM